MKNNVILRDYQKEPIDLGIAFFNSKDAVPSLIVAPTAAGKSLYISGIAHKLKDKTLVIQPSQELLVQNLSKLTDLGGEASVYSASLNTKEFHKKLTYATIGSIKNLGATFKHLGYKNLIIDEADRFPRTMDSMLGKFLQESGINKVLGLTATPFKLWTGGFREDPYSKLVMLTSRSKQGNFFKKIIHVTQIQELVAKSYWPPLLYELFDAETGDLVYNSTKADYTEESLIKFYKNQNIETKIINKIKELSDRKSILIFVPSVADAKHLAKLIPNSAAVYGDMDKKERNFVIEQFKNLNIHIVINVNVLSVGFDHPELDCVIGARPSSSLSWFYQAMARLTRVHPHKKDGLIVDFAGNVQKFGKLEDLVFEKDGVNWKLLGSGKRQLTGVRLDKIAAFNENEDVLIEFGKFTGKKVSETPVWWKKWMLKNYKFNDNTMHLKQNIKKQLC